MTAPGSAPPGGGSRPAAERLAPPLRNSRFSRLALTLDKSRPGRVFSFPGRLWSYLSSGILPVSWLTFFFGPQIATPKYCSELSGARPIFSMNSS